MAASASSAVDFLIAALVILICLLLFAEHIPLPNNLIYAFVAFGFIALLWGIPRMVDTAKFYDYFINTIIVTVGTVVVSITIGSLAGYSLARYTGIAAVVGELVPHHEGANGVEGVRPARRRHQTIDHVPTGGRA